LGGPELLIVFVILALLFGAGRVPHIARTLGQSNREFRRALKEGFGEGPKCDSCGAPLSSDARFCANCGQELEQGSVPVPSPRWDDRQRSFQGEQHIREQYARLSERRRRGLRAATP